MSLTAVGWQTNWSNKIGNWNPIVQSQKCDVIIKVRKTEVLRNGTQNKARFGPHGVIASIVFTECHLDHEPHESERISTELAKSIKTIDVNKIKFYTL